MFKSWPAPAKLNLMLRVTGRRMDGYHTLQTVFQFLDYGDTLHLRVRKDHLINRIIDLPGINAEQDLTIRAARLLQRETGTTCGVDIALDKVLPIGGGLGGGSSNAATVLVALNQQWELGLSEDELAELGLRLGADVPVFVRGHAAWGEGVGEILTPVDLPEPWYLVVNPGCRVTTAEIFNDPELTRDSFPITMRAFLAGDDRNDCERVVRRRHPSVAMVLDWLGNDAHLTGTGACAYVSFPSLATASLILDHLPCEWRGFVARGCNRSPLIEHRKID
ncbi:4-(cytidine 5'-diphospho)-2-C-methyl-D-erythritol kinase [Gammaproteobacteria bacterium]